MPGSRRFLGSGSSAGGSVVRDIEGVIDANGFPDSLVDRILEAKEEVGEQVVTLVVIVVGIDDDGAEVDDDDDDDGVVEMVMSESFVDDETLEEEEDTVEMITAEDSADMNDKVERKAAADELLEGVEGVVKESLTMTEVEEE